MNASLAAVTADDSSTPASGIVSRRLPNARQLRQTLPVDAALGTRIAAQRQAVRDILNGEDDRLLIVTGPCSLHDPEAALEYGRRLAALADRVSDRALLVMRAYVEKPRTTVGWKGLLYDPHLDGRQDLAEGLRVCRELLRDLAGLGLPLASELLSPVAASYLEDLLSWAAIGARTTESQIHRELVSGLSLPVGFKNGTDGGIAVARDAMQAAAHPHAHLGVDDEGHPALLETAGNPDTHLVLRGGRGGPNYHAEQIQAAREQLAQAGLNPRLMVDCSHANSGKDPRRQPLVARDLIQQRRDGERAIAGVMLESHLHDGSQPLAHPLRYGVSITDACLGWGQTEDLIGELIETP
ncbi:MAG TPA: 3-deoxy-7-phosphoheptulonate synthase [Alcanivorax sp.]|nr:3-deoxy-7-phosphoheptulonate synthase [Alcanivorax sp.]HAI33573.1 3-deoxy-7-phosphoheptulonate synthase [Alcanivorax sp.]HAI89030.1 3-deoxy-7-phosphoheptulonate synthase [Alcanivorax sp.]HCD76629.1 3-deoxy-7-phosphoheptulonate synthase [Alcanivorax sp.]HCK27445.1 3-deoxy-7-phosphoheptulonate synthase [Alcanivorax sp.]